MTCNSCYDPCRLIENSNLSDIMVDMMQRTNKDGKERGVFVYRKGENIMVTGIQRGSNNSITIDMPSKILGLILDGKPMATIHTHPIERNESLFSIQDIEQMMDGPLEFSVAIFDDRGYAIADVFDTSKYKSMRELEEKIGEEDGSLEFAQKANKELQSCKMRLGKL